MWSEGRRTYEAWCGRNPSGKHLHTLGCIVHVKTMGGHVGKLADMSSPTILLSYKVGSKAYRAYNPTTKKVQVSRDVVFDEEKAWNWDDAMAAGGDIFIVTCNHIDHIGLDHDGNGHGGGHDVDDVV